MCEPVTIGASIASLFAASAVPAAGAAAVGIGASGALVAGAGTAATVAASGGAIAAGLSAAQILSLGATAASGIASAYGAYSSSKTQSAVARNNAAVADIQATDAQRRGEQDAQAAERQGRQVTGAQRAGYAARGLDLGVGTPSDVIDQTNFFAQSDAATARTNADKEAWALKARSSNQSFLANATSPGLQGAGTLLGSAASVASKWYQYGSRG